MVTATPTRAALIAAACLVALSATAAAAPKPTDIPFEPVPGRWPAEKANAWYAKQPWLVGCNYIPATAINQIEMWQAETFDPKTIDVELGWAEGLGFNTLRVYLHDLVWADDRDGLYARMDRFLAICGKHGIRPLFVFFDDCHYPEPKLGPQPVPVRGWHNSGWLNCPARTDAVRFAEGTLPPAAVARLRGYVQDTMRRFKDDPRVLVWELYNEPGRGQTDPMKDRSAKLLHQAWIWAREVAPSQPLMSSSAGSLGTVNTAVSRQNSDVHSIHAYSTPDALERLIMDYRRDGRPVLCTEYMARTRGSTFQGSLPVLKKHNVAAINWGFVSGKSGTVWPWSSRNGKKVEEERARGHVVKPGDPFPEPETWFHDIYRTDGTPFSQAEIECIRQMTGKAAGGR